MRLMIPALIVIIASALIY